MPPHTISPTPSSSGLGITYSTLSPPPASQPHQSHFTGMGVAPRPNPTLYPPQPSPTRTLPQQPSSHTSRQPTFALRPTHTRDTSAKGFSTFSSIPPSPAGPRPVSSPNTPTRIPRPPATGSMSSRESITPIPSPAPVSDIEVRRTESTSTSGGRSIRKSRSSELFRRFSKSETISGGRYVPLSGADDDNHAEGSGSGQHHDESILLESPVSLPYLEEPSSTLVQRSPTSPPRSRSRSTTISSSHATPSQSIAQSSGLTPSSDTHAFNPSRFPLPPSHPPRSGTTLSDPTEYHQRPQIPLGGMMPRSFSQPLHLYSVPETRRESGVSEFSQPQEMKRSSNLSNGVHSKNAALLSAESGGVMLSFSPSGDGVWRQGEMICGSGTGLIPTPQTIPSNQMGVDDPRLPLKSRPWSDSTISQNQNTQNHPRHPSHRGRSLSDGSGVLNRQGTLFHPSSDQHRASRELGVMLGNKSRKSGADRLLPLDKESGMVPDSAFEEKVRLEVSKKGKARVEVDVVLERECVVEGGEVKGRIEVRVTGGKRSEGLRVGGGKVRVVGFEEISPTSRHIFYHHAHPLPLFAHPTHPSGPSSSLFASDPDSEGYHLASSGSHSIPFNFRLPLGGGAKGSYTSSSPRGPSIRYVVVASVKIHIPSTGKRSIAHFYRSIVVLPYLNPAVVLAPSVDAVEARVEKGLGWSLGGEKGKVGVKVGMGRRCWISGQRAWFEVEIRNESSKRIKTLNLALLQTVQTFNPQPLLDTTDIQARLRLHKRRSQPHLAHDDRDLPEDADACQTSTHRKKICEEVIEADFADQGAGRVTGKGWWTGVEAGEVGRWDLSLLIPNGMISIRRTKLIEVMYTLRVTVNSSIYVDLPIQLINFQSIDPPPMPGDGARLAHAPPIPLNFPIGHSSANPHVKVDPYGRPTPARMVSSDSLSSGGSGSGSREGKVAKASSTTLHLDALLTAGRARAEAEEEKGLGNDVHVKKSDTKTRPVSMGSTYTVDQSKTHSRSQSYGSISFPVLPPPTSSHRPLNRPKGGRLMSYLSVRSDATSALFSEHDDNEEDDPEGQGDDGEIDDEGLAAARRAQGRQKSLAALNRAMDRVKAEEEGFEDILSPTREVEEGEYFPEGTPEEEVFGFVQDTPSVQQYTPQTGVDEVIHQEGEGEGELEEAIVDELIAHRSSHGHGHEDQEGDLEEIEAFGQPPGPMGDSGGYDYSDDIEDDTRPHSTHLALPRMPSPRRISLPRHLPKIDVDPRLSFSDFDREAPRDRAGHIQKTRSVYGSYVSDNESEVGQVQEAVRRNVSIKVPSRLLPLSAKQELDDEEGGNELSGSPGREEDRSLREGGYGFLAVDGHHGHHGGRRSSHTPNPTLYGSMNSRRGFPQGRRGSAPTWAPPGAGMRRESSNPPVSSPLRPLPTEHEEEVEQHAPARGITKKPSFTLAVPNSPLRIRNPSLTTPSGVSPRTTSVSLLNPSPHLEYKTRQPSGSSMLRNEIPLMSPGAEDQDEGDGIPGLAPSIASDSASSDGHALESPPAPFSEPISISRTLPKLPTIRPPSDEVPNFNFHTYKIGPTAEPSWTPPDHMLRAQINLARLHTQLDYEPENAYAHSPSSRPVEEFEHDHGSIEGHDALARSRPESSLGHSSSNHSVILPGVRNKIAMLESRDEALRKFSVSGAVISPISPVRGSTSSTFGSISSPVPIKMRESITSDTTPNSKRKSYSTALAPRPTRSTSDDSNLGGTTYIRPRGHSERKSYYSSSGFGEGDTGGLRRQGSERSDYSSATALEVALAGTGSISAKRGWGVGSGSGHGNSWEGVVAEETSDSEGLL